MIRWFPPPSGFTTGSYPWSIQDQVATLPGLVGYNFSEIALSMTNASERLIFRIDQRHHFLFNRLSWKPHVGLS